MQWFIDIITNPYIVFKGIPFAAPPVGNLRWAPPQEPAKWEGVRQCFKYLAAPVQPGPEENPRVDDLYSKEWSVDTTLQLNEDCLYLNIWTPAKKQTKNSLYIFGFLVAVGKLVMLRKWNLTVNELLAAALLLLQ